MEEGLCPGALQTRSVDDKRRRTLETRSAKAVTTGQLRPSVVRDSRERFSPDSVLASMPMTDRIPTFETRHPAGGAIAPHRHEAAYVAIVLEGGYQESSIDGTWLCEPGDWVV